MSQSLKYRYMCYTAVIITIIYARFKLGCACKYFFFQRKPDNAKEKDDRRSCLKTSRGLIKLREGSKRAKLNEEE